jgi:hypothetical protein
MGVMLRLYVGQPALSPVASTLRATLDEFRGSPTATTSRVAPARAHIRITRDMLNMRLPVVVISNRAPRRRPVVLSSVLIHPVRIGGSIHTAR